MIASMGVRCDSSCDSEYRLHVIRPVIVSTGCRCLLTSYIE